jgi:hypothetical protein
MNIKTTDWLYKFSPMIICSMASVVGVIYYGILINQSDGWSLIGVLIYVALMPVFYVFDFLVKFTVNSNVRKIWIIEVVILIIMLVFRDSLSEFLITLF